MGRTRNPNRSPAPAAGASALPSPPAHPQSPPGRRWAFRLGALLLGPVLVLGCLEVVLRLCGYGFPTSFFKPVTIGGLEYLVDNDQFSLSFFPPSLARIPAPVVMKAHKPADTIRIFVFGESAALGDPRPGFGASRYLEVLLRERFPNTHFEIINTGVTAINSHVILPIARECARRQGDIWIVYMGNNEMVGPFGAATVFGGQAPPLGMVRLSLAIQQTRLGQLLMACTRQLGKRSATPANWHGMEMFLQNQVLPQDPRKEVVYRSFRRNLQDILRAGQQAHAKILLNTVAVNLKDCPPFATLTATNLAQADQVAFEQLCSEAAQAAAQGNLAQAQQRYTEAARRLPLSAEVQFRLGECALRQTNYAAARLCFQRALDADLLPFRTDSRLNGLIRQVGLHLAGPNLTFCDAAELLATNSPSGIAGQESFYEHVHFNFDGNYRLARLWADALFPWLDETVGRGATPPCRTNEGPTALPRPARWGEGQDEGPVWASQETCERLLGLTDWNRLSVILDVIGRVNQPPLNSQLNHTRRLEGLELWAKELREHMAATPHAQARAVYAEALHHDPDNYRLHDNFAEFLDLVGDLKEAAAERARSRDLIPHYYFSHYSLGLVLKQLGRLDEARDALLQAVALNPQLSEVHQELGTVYARRLEWALAAQEYERAHQLRPEDPQVLLYSGEVLWKLNRRVEALEQLRQALRLNPGYWEAHYRLGEDLAVEGHLAEAAAEFKETLQLNPRYVKAHVNLAIACLKLGRSQEAAVHFEETLRLDPNNKQALEFQRQTRGQDRH